MKTKEELNAIKEELATLNKKLAELNEDELAQVIGGVSTPFDTPNGKDNNSNPTNFEIDESRNQYELNFYKMTDTKDFRMNPGK